MINDMILHVCGFVEVSLWSKHVLVRSFSWRDWQAVVILSRHSVCCLCEENVAGLSSRSRSLSQSYRDWTLHCIEVVGTTGASSLDLNLVSFVVSCEVLFILFQFEWFDSVGFSIRYFLPFVMHGLLLLLLLWNAWRHACVSLTMLSMTLSFRWQCG